VTGHLTYDANVARLDDLRRRAERRRPAHDAVDRPSPASRRTQVSVAADVTIRRAIEADRATLDELAALDSATALAGEILIAEVDGQPVAALEVGSGATIADPFRLTAAVVELLGLRAARLRGEAPRRRLRLRAAYRPA
jgi:hypothetical protein